MLQKQEKARTPNKIETISLITIKKQKHLQACYKNNHNFGLPNIIQLLSPAVEIPIIKKLRCLSIKPL
jgi:hypothetical protein